MNPLDWVAKAEDDYALMLLALRRKRPILYGITFHAQQCAEKYLKSLLIFRGHTVPRTHDLELLADLCLAAGFIVPVEREELRNLTQQGVRSRYPDDLLSLEDAKAGFEIAKAVRAFARPILK